jgi:DNA polymerase III subunit epsilon
LAFSWIGKSKDGTTVTLHKLNLDHFKSPSYYSANWAEQKKSNIQSACIVDLETTGLNFEVDKIIEIGIRQFDYNIESGEILTLKNSYAAFQDPQQNLSDEIKRITGITDDQLKDQQIDWRKVDDIFSTSHIIIAHNAAFDRPFVDQYSSVSQKALWGCSVKQIDWSAKGFTSSKLELLNVYHGFFTDSHRALNDVDAVLTLLNFKDGTNDNTRLLELLHGSSEPTIKVEARRTAFETKDKLKSKNYRWDVPGKYWYKNILKSQLSSEIEWLEAEIYKGKFLGQATEIPAEANFKK